jgi:recombinational DNA repair ATPase RecF
MDIQLLTTLCNLEKSYADRLVKLDQVLDRALKEGKPIPEAELKTAARKFVEMADDLDEWRANAFFAIFDKIVQAALKDEEPGKPQRESAMVLEITPAGKKKVTKVLMQQR